MSNYGMTGAGFVPKRLAEIRSDLIAKVSNIQDPTTGEYPFINIDDDSVVAMIVGIFSEQLASAWEASYEAYKQFDPLQNSGPGQSATVQLNGITRRWGVGSELSFTLRGLTGYTVPKGSKISDQQGVYVFETLTDATIGANGEAKVTGICLTKGPLEFAKGEINSIQTPMYGWSGAVNTEQLTIGTLEETDEQLRERQQVSTSLTSYRQVEAIYAAVRAVEGTKFVRVFVNSSEYPTDTRGIPFKEIAVLAEGGDPDAIVDAMWYRLPVGVQGYGTTKLTRYDSQGLSYTIAFSRPTEVPIYVEVRLRITNRVAYPDDAPAQIKANIVAYAEYAGSSYEGFPPGADVITSRLYTPVNEVPGFSVDYIKIGLSAGAVKTDNITIDWNKVARFSESRIQIVVDGA